MTVVKKMEEDEKGPIRKFMDHTFRHFNSAVTVDASRAFEEHLKKGGKMLLAMAGAMSTGEIGKAGLAEMIRQNKIHAISTTGANLEEDIFNLVAHDHYVRVPDWRQLSPEDEVALLEQGLNRVTDTCIPEEEAMRKIERELIPLWKRVDKNNESFFPYEYIYQLIRGEKLEKFYQINPKDSWVIAACEKNLPIWTPGWEDSTLGNIFAALTRGRGKNYYGEDIKNIDIVKTGPKQMNALIDWYLENSKDQSIGFFQIGGGIAGDFAICVVPLIRQDLKIDCRLWGYFCQVSDSTTSYGSYSGAVPNEKITWEKLGPDTPRFIIESDASIVAPMIFAYVLNR